MKRKKDELTRKVRLRVLMNMAAILGIMVLAPIAAQAMSNPNPGILPVNSHPYGMTYGEWSAKWWQWAYSIPLPQNPLVDDTGANTANNQSGPVWFLAGKFCTTPCGTPEVATANRVVNVPAGKALFIPILSIENDNFSYSSPVTETQLWVDAKKQMDTGENMAAEIDGVSIKGLGSALTTEYRVTSPGLFIYHIPDNNIYALFHVILPAQDVPAVADGVFLMLAPLPEGQHKIHFKGDFPTTALFGAFALDIKYTINVVAGKS